MAETVEPEVKAHKASHIGAPAVFKLEQACQQLHAAYDHPTWFMGIFHVGSSLERADWRDVDVRMILADEYFEHLFPNACMKTGSWEFDQRWILLTVSISDWLSRLTGLPIDFQFQPMTHANERHKKARNALGLIFSRSNPHG